jgi:hypothetical protein
MKRNSPAVLFLACFLTAALLLPPGMLALADSAGQRAGQIDRMIPVVGITRGKQNITAAAKTVVNWDDVVNTQSSARARIVLDDGSILNVGSESSLRVVKHDAGGQQTELELTYGKLRSQATKITKPGGKFEVRTPAGVVGVVGSDWFVSFLNNLMMVIVYEGIVRVCNLAGVCVNVAAGQYTSVSAGDNSPPLPPASAKVETRDGLRTVAFDTVYGVVKAYLPDDMAAGDTISGILLAEPKGQTEEERSKNMSALSEYMIQLGAPTKSDGTSDFTTNVPVSAARNPFTLQLPPSSILTSTVRSVSSGDSGGLGITLTNTSGSFSTGGTTTIPIELVSLSLQSVAPLKVTYQLPTIGQQGRPIEIFGPFDGNSQNTVLNWTAVRSKVQDFEKNTENVSGGFGLIAESPRKAVFEAPTNVTGPLQLHLTEGTSVTSGEYRNVGVKLSAPKTNLLRGEHTTLTIEVSGLQGIKQPVPLTLESKGVITMEGGMYQPLVIQPSQVGPDGRYTTTRGITGVQAGVWAATATVVTHRFDFCLQDDSNPRTVILVNTFNGDYIFTPSGGTSLSGTGTVTRKDCIITLTDSQPDRRVQGNIDPCTKTGSASVQVVSPKVKFTITDRNTANNTCTCGPGCK